MESWPDLLMLMRAPKGLMQHVEQVSFNNLRKTGIPKRIRKAPVQADPFRLDEVALEVGRLAQTRSASLLGAFHAEIFCMINFDLGSLAHRALAELRMHACEMLKSLHMRELAEKDNVPSGWTFKLDVGYWTHSQTPVSYMRSCYFHDKPETGIEQESALMDRNHLCAACCYSAYRCKRSRSG